MILENLRQIVIRSVDDTPYGGGQGMVLMCKPLLDCLKTVVTKDSLVILMSLRV